MLLYVNDTNYTSWSVKRVIDALIKYKPPNAEIVDREKDADFVVLHVYGRIDQLRKRINSLQNKKFAVIQYTLRASRNPLTTDWLPIWKQASATWSYLNLEQMSREDHNVPDFNFYYAPLGVEDIFKPLEKTHKYQICSSGAMYMTEGVRECHKASQAVGRLAAHLGPKVRDYQDFHCYTNITDDEVIRLYNDCDYVAAFRRKEGFEFPAAEGLCCGVRPILFDAPHYRRWYDGLGIFVREEGRDVLINDLIQVFSKDLSVVTNDEIEEAKWRFNWERLVKGFYERTGLRY